MRKYIVQYKVFPDREIKTELVSADSVESATKKVFGRFFKENPSKKLKPLAVNPVIDTTISHD